MINPHVDDPRERWKQRKKDRWQEFYPSSGLRRLSPPFVKRYQQRFFPIAL
ncbi:hypothetical protein [Prochlorococcus marinus]|nr:hypothetical protein [Prochlorococcus marinus]